MRANAQFKSFIWNVKKWKLMFEIIFGRKISCETLILLHKQNSISGVSNIFQFLWAAKSIEKGSTKPKRLQIDPLHTRKNTVSHSLILGKSQFWEILQKNGEMKESYVCVFFFLHMATSYLKLEWK